MDSSDREVVLERFEDEPEKFKRISIPLVRRIYPQLMASKIVSVQPLSRTTGLEYYMRFKYSSNSGGKVEMVEEPVVQNQVTIEEIDKPKFV